MHINLKPIKKKAEKIGLSIQTVEDPEGVIKYIVSGGFLEDETETYASAIDLREAVNELFMIATEPEIEAYIDESGEYQERLIYPFS